MLTRTEHSLAIVVMFTIGVALLSGCSSGDAPAARVHFNQVQVGQTCSNDLKQAAADYARADASPNPQDDGSTLRPGDLAYNQALRDCHTVDEFESGLSQNLGATIWTSAEFLNPVIDIGGSCQQLMTKETPAVCQDAIKIGLDKQPGY